MAWQNKVLDISCRASTNVSAITRDANGNYSSGGIQAGIVVIADTSDGTIGAVTIASTGNAPLGVANTWPAAGTGDSVEVTVLGVARCQASAAITGFGTLVYVANSSGQVGPVPADGATSVYLVGMALEGATQAGDYVTVLLTPGGSQHVTS